MPRIGYHGTSKRHRQSLQQGLRRVESGTRRRVANSAKGSMSPIIPRERNSMLMAYAPRPLREARALLMITQSTYGRFIASLRWNGSFISR